MTAIRLLTVLSALLLTASVALGQSGRLEIRAVDQASGQPMAARMHLKNAKAQPVKPPKVPYWKDHFDFDGTMVLDLPLGAYAFEIEAGPEYKFQSGSFMLERGANDT